jgi:hypothetical protein
MLYEDAEHHDIVDGTRQMIDRFKLWSEVFIAYTKDKYFREEKE